MPVAQIQELKRALANYDLERKRKSLQSDAPPATDLTHEMQLNVEPHATLLPVEEEDDAEEEMVIHRSARKPPRSHLYRSSDEHSPSTPENARPIPRHSVNSAATLQDTPSPPAARRSGGRHVTRLMSSSSESGEEQGDELDEEVSHIIGGLKLEVHTHIYARVHTMYRHALSCFTARHNSTYSLSLLE